MSNDLIYENDLPKGMEPRAAQEAPESKSPAPQHLHLGRGNYAGAIRLALDLLPVEIRYDRFLVVEQDGAPPRIRLSLTILGEKEGYREREDP